MRTLQKMKSRKLSFETLENRELLSVNPFGFDVDDKDFEYAAATIVANASTPPTVSLQGNTLTINGTSDNDYVTVKESGQNIQVYFTVNSSGQPIGNPTTYAQSQVASIIFNGYDGDDAFRNYTTINSTIDGGNGNNLLLGGRGTNTFTNTGNGSNQFAAIGNSVQWTSGSSLGNDDSLILFANVDRYGNATGSFRSANDISYVVWTDIKVDNVLDTVSSVYDSIGNYGYFRNNNTGNGEIFMLVSDSYDVLDNVAGYNWNGDMVYQEKDVNPRLTIHEVGHNWDDATENPFFEEFAAISYTGNTLKPDAVAGDFAFGRLGIGGNSKEDWAYAISLVFDGYGDSNEDNTAPATAKYKQKVEIIERFGAWLGGSVTAPETPSDFKITSTSGTLVTLSWGQQSALTGYTLQYKKTTESNWTTVNPAPAVNASAATVAGLLPSTAYNFRIQATNSNGSSAWATANITTTAQSLATITEAEFEDIRTKNADLKLEAFAKYNIIVIEAANLSEAALLNAVAQAETVTNKHSLIVLRTTESKSTITLTTGLSLTTSGYNNKMVFVGYGNQNLTLKASGWGTGIWLRGGSYYEFAGITFSNCELINNGGYYTYVTNCKFEGSATRFSSSAWTYASNCEFVGVGEVYAHSGPTYIDNCVFKATYINNHMGYLEMSNCLITGNSTFTITGQLCDGYWEGGETTLFNCTITGNASGGISVEGDCSLEVINSIIADNRTFDISGTGNIIGNNNLSSFTAWQNGNSNENIVYSATKQLFADADEGDYRLISGSQAIDKGSNADIIDYYNSGYNKDIAGNDRIYGNTVDIGAYEWQGVDPPKVVAVPKNLRTTSVGKTTTMIEWNKIKGTANYVLQQKTDSGNWETIYEGTASQYAVSGLTAGATYSYRIQANGSEFSNAITVTTTAASVKVADVPAVTKTELDTTGTKAKATIEWTDLGSDYSYYVFRNGSLVSVAQDAAEYVDNNAPETVRYLLYAYQKSTGQWGKSLPIVLSSSSVKSEIVNHTVTAEGGITLNWNIPESQQFVIFRNGIPVSGNVNGQSWTDTQPRNDDNQYTLYVNYKDEQSGRYVWTYSKTYVVSKSANAQATALPENFWSVYDLDLLDDVLIAI